VIGATTRLTGLLGWPVSHSLSPRMQNAAFAARALDWAYLPLPVPPERLADAVRGLAALGFAGANVTIPHKVAVAELCDELDEVARRAGSVNTLVFRDGRVLGSSTDGLALVEPLGDSVRGARALVLGAGGAARAAIAALEDAGAQVRVAARRGEWPPELRDATLIVNATPVKEELLVEPRREHAVVDLAYLPDGRPTALVAGARAAGCSVVVDGLDVLVRQGAAAFERWTGVPAPVEVMRAAVAGRASLR
jgi:shikimate dehydrogenase